MTSYIREVEERKTRLRGVAAVQRVQLKQITTAWRRPAQVVSSVNSFVRNPFVLAGFGLLMAKMPWKRAIKVSRFAYKGWKILKVLQLFRRFV
jgi:hypothetical protein